MYWLSILLIAALVPLNILLYHIKVKWLWKQKCKSKANQKKKKKAKFQKIGPFFQNLQSLFARSCKQNKVT